MRAVRISLVLLLAMAAVMGACVMMNGHVCGRMKKLVNELPTRAEEVQAEEMGKLSAFWSEWSGRMRPTVNASLWRTVNDLTGDVVLYGGMGERAAVEYAATRQRLLYAIDEMSRPNGRLINHIRW